MPTAESAPPAWSRLCAGPNADVWVHEKCAKEMLDIEARQRAHIRSSMEDFYCQMERPEQVPNSRLSRDEGSRKVGGREFRAQAFKNVQGRVYGVEGSINGKRVFFAACAAVKKTEKVDPSEVDRAIKRIQDVADCVPGAKL